MINKIFINPFLRYLSRVEWCKNFISHLHKLIQIFFYFSDKTKKLCILLFKLKIIKAKNRNKILNIYNKIGVSFEKLDLKNDVAGIRHKFG